MEVVYDWDVATDTIRWGDDLETVLGIENRAEVATGIGYAARLAPQSPTSRYDAVMAPGARDTGSGVPYCAVYALRPAPRSKDAPIWIEDTGLWFGDAQDRPVRAQGRVKVVTDRILAERAVFDAARDPLTGALSLAQFKAHVARQLAGPRRPSGRFAVLLIDVTIEQGADADVRLAAATARLRAHMRAQEICARQSDRRLAVLLETCKPAQVEAAAARFIAAIEDARAEPRPPRCRIGAVLASSDGGDPDAIFALADEALAAARRPQAPSFVRFDLGTRRSATRVGVQDEVAAALQDGRVVLALQPVVHARTRAIAFHEALVRVRRRDGTLLLPEVLVPSAEAAGLAATLDRRVLDLAMSMLTADRRLSLSINPALASLGDAGWFDPLSAASRLRPDAARRLTIEVDEAGLLADLDGMGGRLARLRALGVRIAVDHFGPGGATFRTLRALPIDLVKIDATFTHKLAARADDRLAVRSLIDLARNLGVEAVAEWVEDEASARLLAEWGVSYLQGHLFGQAALGRDLEPARAAG